MAIDLNSLTIGELKQLTALAAGFNGGPVCDNRPHWSVGKYCVIRTYTAGVHFGIVESKSGQEVVLSGARRLWSWKGANTLNEVATVGVGSGTNASDPVRRVELTQAIEIIQCSEAGEQNLRAAKWGK